MSKVKRHKKVKDIKLKKLVLMGRSESGKTTLKQALKGEHLTYEKTQTIEYGDYIIDTPGEYAQVSSLAHSLALYAYEADVVGLLVAATEPYSLFPPNITCMVNRDVIGIVTKSDVEHANGVLATKWLQLAGCTTIFEVNAFTGEGIKDIISYLEVETI